MEKNKKNIYPLIYTVLILILIYTVFTGFKVKFGKIYSHYYELIQDEFNYIEENLDNIANKQIKDGMWIELKDFTIEDKTTEENLNKILQDISKCYNELQTSDIVKSKNKRLITEKRIEELANETNCVDGLTKYTNIKFSEEEAASRKKQDQIKIILTKENPNEEINSFALLLHDKTDDIKRLSNLTKWLVIEYNTFTQREV